jgi:hypothetical protein
MLRIGIGLGVVALAIGAFFGWLRKHDAATYQRARVEITRALQEDAAAKERAAIEAEDAVTPTPADPAALAALCKKDVNCREADSIK